MNILKLEKRGCDFSPYDERVKDSDIGNYRVCTEAFSVRGKNGRDYFLEITRGDKYATRRTNKRTGKPLTHPVREMVAQNVAFINACFRDSDGVCWGDTTVWRKAYDEPRPYTTDGILDIVNSVAAVPYDGVELIPVCG